MRISLVVPDFLSGTSFLQQPLDFLYCATLLEQSGHKVKVLDCRTSHYSSVAILKQLADSELIILTTTPCDQVQNYFVDYRYGYAVTLANYIKVVYDPQFPVISFYQTISSEKLRRLFR